MPDVEQLIKLVTAQHRWAIHPIKVVIALLLPVMLVWLADWRIRRLSSTSGAHEARPIGTEPTHSPLGG